MAKKSRGGGADSRPTQEEICQEIERLAKPNGDIDPDDVIKAARNPDNILHGAFEWNQDILVQRELRRQAADLIKKCREFQVYGEHVVAYPKFVNNPETVNKTYSRTVVIARNEALKTMALEAELVRIK